MSLLERLPSVRGKLIAHAPLAPYTWLRVGGPADVLFLPKDEADLALFLAQTPDDVPVHILGVGSNVLIRDGGMDGVVIRLSPAFAKVRTQGLTVTAGAAALDRKIADEAAKAGIAGLEFFIGIPGTLGGALRMNAGCYGAETKDRLRKVIALDRMGRRIVATPEEMAYSYRHSGAPADWIFIEASFEGDPDDAEAIRERMDAITARREASQPIREKTSGSTFANPDPPGTENQRSSWKLIDSVGGRGRRIGGAMFSDQHCNFLINTGEASAADLEALGEAVRADVRRVHGVDLRWEVRRWGRREVLKTLALESRNSLSDAQGSDARRSSPSAERNRDVIRETLSPLVPRGAHVLEIASGTGQHAVHMAAHRPDLVWKPSDPDEDARASVDAWRVSSALGNIEAALALDVTRADWWRGLKADAVFCANMIHIAPWAATKGLFEGAGQILADDGRLFLYGPFSERGEHNAPSNAQFDKDLKRRNPDWGVRDLADVAALAAANGFALHSQIAMPANNRLVVFHKRTRL